MRDDDVANNICQARALLDVARDVVRVGCYSLTRRGCEMHAYDGASNIWQAIPLLPLLLPVLLL